MPIGVPKVEYRLPGEPEADWLDLYNCLYRERMLFLCQDLGDEVANQLISLMLYLNTEDPSLPFFMYINSLGGSVTCGIGVFDIMRYLHSGITTICMGTASSMASFVLAGGTYGRRLSLPHGRIMIHQPEGEATVKLPKFFRNRQRLVVFDDKSDYSTPSVHNKLLSRLHKIWIVISLCPPMKQKITG